MNQSLADTLPTTAARAVPSADDPRAATARRIFRGALVFNAALTLFWLASWATDSRFFFSEYRITLRSVGNVLGGIAFFYVLWGFIWWGLKSLALRWVGFSKDERRDAFSSRMDRPYDVG